MNIFLYLRRHRAECLLCAILALSAFLNIWNIWNQGDTNYYYSAAVKSMLVNPVAGFFNSFDPAGFITVDKPPVGLWVQAAFAAVLGFRDWILILPQALAGIGSVALIYFIVSRPFGKPAGFVAALALALTPIFVAIARNGTMDSQLIFVLLLAVWAVPQGSPGTIPSVVPCFGHPYRDRVQHQADPGIHHCPGRSRGLYHRDDRLYLEETDTPCRPCRTRPSCRFPLMGGRCRFDSR